MINIDTILMYVFGGTSVSSIIMYFLEKKKRKIEHKKLNQEVKSDEFASLYKLINFQEESINKYQENERNRMELDDKQREDLIKIKRCKHEIELKMMQLERDLSIAKLYVCTEPDCERRKKHEG